MTLGRYLRLVLTSDARVAALAGGRVYTEVLPQSPAVPALVFTEVAGGDDYTLDGPSGAASRRVQVDTWAKKRSEATDLARAVRAALSGYTGAAGGLEVEGVFLLNERWDFDAPTALYRTSQDYEVWMSGDVA